MTKIKLTEEFSGLKNIIESSYPRYSNKIEMNMISETGVEVFFGNYEIPRGRNTINILCECLNMICVLDMDEDGDERLYKYIIYKNKDKKDYKKDTKEILMKLSHFTNYN